MTKIDALRRCLPSCCLAPSSVTPAAATTTTTTTTTHHTFRRRISTSLRDDIEDIQDYESRYSQDSAASNNNRSSVFSAAPPRFSRAMVIGTVFGQRKGHVWFCIHQDLVSTKRLLLIELPITTHHLVREMSSGIVRLFLECDGSELRDCSLRSVPMWTMICNGKRIGFAYKRKPTDQIRLMLMTIKSVTVGAGVVPVGLGPSGSDQEGIIYMRTHYEHVVANANSESFYLVNPDKCSGQEFAVFLMRSG